MLGGMGIQHDIKMSKLVEAGDFITKAIGRNTNSRAAAAILAKKK
jgi:hypothetical protein